MVREEDKKTEIGNSFRGKGNVKPHEREAWLSEVDVYFQSNAWVDGETCMEWTERTLKNFVDDEKLEKFVLLCDNPEAQCSDQFKEKVRDLHGVVWYVLKNDTDL